MQSFSLSIHRKAQTGMKSQDSKVNNCLCVSHKTYMYHGKLLSSVRLVLWYKWTKHWHTSLVSSRNVCTVLCNHLCDKLVCTFSRPYIICIENTIQSGSCQVHNVNIVRHCMCYRDCHFLDLRYYSTAF